MSSFGEKFLVKKIEGNKVIKVSEWKEFEDNFEDIVQDINDSITDDPEELYYNYGIAMDFDSFVWLDCDACIDGINEFLDNCDEDELKEYDWLQGYLPYLKKAEGYTIYFKNEAKDYKPDECQLTGMEELAIQQFIGYQLGSKGFSVSELVSSMALKKAEWNRIKKEVDESLIDEVEECFEDEEDK
jgi:hypothetical protein